MSERSSIRIRNIFHMLCYAFQLLRQGNYADIAAEDFEHVQDLLAAILARGIARQLKQGLHKSYITRGEEGSTLRGKLGLLETKRLRARHIPRLACLSDELSADNGLNRILRATAWLLLRCDEVGIERKRALKRVLQYLADISGIYLATVRWRRLKLPHNGENYAMLMNICEMAWLSLLPSTRQGDRHFTLFDEESMPRLYERFILEYFRRHWLMLHPASGDIHWDIPDDTDPELARQLPGMHTDVTLRRAGRTLIIDAKYYRRALSDYMGKNMLHSANLYQIYAYVKNEDRARTGNVSGLLLYARTGEEVPPMLDVLTGGNRIGATYLDLNRPFADIAMRLDGIVTDRFGVEGMKLE